MPNKDVKVLTPRQIAEELDKHIIGQRAAKKTLAVALKNRVRRQQADPAIRNEIMSNNIILIGSTGVGKTECARRMARLTSAPFIKVEATQYTERGYVGSEVKSMINSLAEQALQIVTKEFQKKILSKAKHNVEQTILDALLQNLPYPTPVVAEEAMEKPHNNAATRALLLQQLRKGELDEREIKVSLQEKPPTPIGFVGTGQDLGIESMMEGLQDMFKKTFSQKTPKKKVTIAQATNLLLEQEKERFLSEKLDTLKEEARARVEREGIIFIDEIDKIATTGRSSGPDVSRGGVQRDLLPILEGTVIPTKIGSVKTDHILFIAAGAFHHARPSDLIPELQGRFPIRVELDSLTKEDLERILHEPKNSLKEQQEALFRTEGVELCFQADAIKRMAEIAFTLNQEVEDIGARRLHTLLSQLLQDYFFDSPDHLKEGKKIVISSKEVNKKFEPLLQTKKNSTYIL